MEERVTFARVAARKTMPPETNPSEAEMISPPPLSRFSGNAGSESYAEAVKTSRSVWLDGVPLSSAKLRARGQLATTSCMESVTNSTLQEQESVLSSWADDDQCFFESIRVSSAARDPPREDHPNTHLSHPNGHSNGHGGARRGKGGRGWRTIPGGEGNAGSGNGRRRRHTNGASWGGHHTRKGSGTETSSVSGGRFDALADVALRRHL